MLSPSLRLTAIRARPTVWVLLAVWYLMVVVFSWYTGADYLSRDQWHFLAMVDHFLSGTLGWRELWQSHSEHVKPAYKLLFALNAKYLGLNMMVEIMTGLALLGIATLLILREMRLSSAPTAPLPWFALLVAGMILMSFNQWANYTYGLLALGGFGGILVQLLLFIGFAVILQRRVSMAQLTLLTAILLLGVWGFSGARSPAVLGACALAAAAAFIVDPQARGRILRLGVPLLLVGAGAIAVYLKLLQLDHQQDILRNLRFILQDPVGALTYVSGILAESMVSLDVAAAYFPAEPTLWVLVLLGYLMLGWSLWRYFRAGLWRNSWVPLMLIAYSGLFALEILVGRYGSDKWVLHGFAVPRYVFDTHLWMLGCAWIMGLDWAQASPSTQPSGQRRRVANVLLCCLFVLEGFNLELARHQWHYYVKHKAMVEAQMHAIAAGTASVDSLPRWVCPSNALCAQGFEILKRYHLNVAKDLPPGP